MITNSTHSAELIKEKKGIAMYEITNDETGKSSGFFVVERDASQVKSTIPADCPRSGQWFANSFSAEAVTYVANGRSRSTAQRWFRKLTTAL